MGLDPADLLDEAMAAHEILVEPDSPAVLLAVAMTQQARRGPVMTLASSAALPGLGDWIEQLVAESTGKDGKGILPVVVESAESIDFRGADRLSVLLGSGADADLSIDAPLGGQFLLWEWATAIAGHLMGIDPFNQPNVTESKTNTSALLDEWQGVAPSPTPDAIEGAIEIFGASSLREALTAVTGARYLAIMAYLDRGSDDAIARLRPILASAMPEAGVTFGWGPRFLHSTGQFHKGGPQTGAFLQITGAPAHDTSIPGREYGFATLQLAQALGDVRALASRGRPVIRLHLRDRAVGIEHLLSVALSL
jgi:glucose-6-phosphate isomerase